MIHLILILGLTAFGYFMRHFSSLEISESAAYAMGMMMLVGYCAGKLVQRRSLPAVTGYLLAGMVMGPFVMKLITLRHVADLQLINGLALSLIALTAGGEIRLARLRPHLKSIAWVLLSQSLIMVAGMTIGFWLLSVWGLALSVTTQAGVIAAGLLLGIVSTASSPSTTLAVIVEYGTRTALTDWILGVVMLKDIVILFLFCIGLNVAHSLTSSAAAEVVGIAAVSIQISGSLLAGLVIGLIIMAYMRHAKSRQVVFILAVCFFAYEVFEPLKLHPLLIMMTAGFLVVNLSREGDRLMDHLEEISPPVYVLFFTLAGATLRLPLLKSFGLVAMVLVILRLVCKWGGTWIGLRMAGNLRRMRHRGWTAFVSQAGLSLGMAIIIQEQFPGWGESVAMLILAVVFINQLIGPLTLKWLLDRDGNQQSQESI